MLSAKIYSILTAMKVIVTHTSPDWDALTSVWLIWRFLPRWESARVEFVPAGMRWSGVGNLPKPSAKIAENGQMIERDKVIEIVSDEEVIHVDTGMGPLDHHQTQDMNVCGASRAWDYIKTQNKELTTDSEKMKQRVEALSRIVAIVIDIDHFQEVYWQDPAADYQEFSLLGVLEGLKFKYPDDDKRYLEFAMQCLDAELHNFENRIWAEKEIKETGKLFKTRFGNGLAFETINDTVLKLAQKMGSVMVVRKDPRKGYVRIKVRPINKSQKSEARSKNTEDIDLTLAYERLKKMDPEATWFLHVSKKMLLNGTPKNPKMIPSILSLDQIIRVLEEVYN